MSVIDQDVVSIINQPLPWEKFDGKTILVTGASGMIGQYIVNVLVGLVKEKNINLKVIAMVRNQAKAERLFKEDSNLQSLVQDVTKPFEISDKVDYIIHTASPASPRAFKEDPVGVIGANILGSMNSLELAKRDKAVYLFISSLEAYGNMESKDGQPLVVAEEAYGVIDSLDARSAYPESKRLGENLCVAYDSQYGVDYKIARLTHTYGPGMDIGDNRVQAEFIRNALNAGDIILKSDGSLQRTYTYIADATAAIFYILLKDDGRRVYNVANETARVSIKQLAEAVLKAAGNKSKLVFDIPADSSTQMWSRFSALFVNCDRLKSLGWQAKVGIDDGMTRTLEFYKSEAVV